MPIWVFVNIIRAGNKVIHRVAAGGKFTQFFSLLFVGFGADVAVFVIVIKICKLISYIIVVIIYF